VKKVKVIVLEKATLKVREPNFCVPLCRTVCGGYYIDPQ
jgi:hypothetical protein